MTPARTRPVIRPALPVPDGTPFHRHGVPVVGRCGGAGRVGRLARRHSERRQFAERGAQRLLIGRSAGGQTVAGCPRQRPSPRPRLYRPADYVGQAEAYVQHLSSSGAAAGLLLVPPSLDNIYRCLNRCVLYILSRPAESVSEQMSILETLHKLTTNRYVSVRLFLHFIFKNKF